MDLRGQVSAEFLLIVSFILLIVLVFSSIAGPQSQENSIAASAKEGASSAVAEITYSNVSMKPVKVMGVRITGGRNKTVTINLDSPLPQNYRATVINRTVEYILNLGGGVQRVNDTTVKLGDRTYTITLSP
ncbi:MAG: hypothetical protein QMC92_02735 [Methanothermobacter wolfeii]|nr:hypothetical protein [Methanothermobacter wolfeii]